MAVNTRLFMKDVSVKIIVPASGAYSAAVEYNCDVNTVEVLSKPGSTVTYQTLCPSGVLQQIGASTYSVRLKGVQDWGTDGLSAFLWNNHGQTARLICNAHGAAAAYAPATPGFDAQVVLIEGTYGGEAGKYAEYDVEMPCTVRPTLITTTPTALYSDEPGAEPVAA